MLLYLGLELYQVNITILPIGKDQWLKLVQACSGKIDSLVELLQGKFSKNVMSILTEDDCGLFPKPDEISMDCSCPDWAEMCKHVSAALHGIGALLDTQPELLFTLRDVDHLDLLSSASTSDALFTASSEENILSSNDLSSIFGVDIEEERPKEKLVKKKVAVKPQKKKKRTNRKV